MGGYSWGWMPYVPVAEQRRKAAREIEKRKKQGQALSPVIIEGRTIATTFWGKAWCENLERYSDYASRLPRGRSYVRNGLVIDLQIAPGAIHAYVSGSELYKVVLEIEPVTKAQWKSICKDCAGTVTSLVELLQGRLSEGVMERICRQNHGLFPSLAEIRFSCSCPDWAGLCKHTAAVLYGIGARFDHQPELLFRLRAVDERELLANAGKTAPLAQQKPATGKILGGGNLSEMFGLDMQQSAPSGAELAKRKPAKPKSAKKAAAVSIETETSKPSKQAAAAPKAKRKLPSAALTKRRKQLLAVKKRHWPAEE